MSFIRPIGQSNDNQATFLTDKLVARHQCETDALLRSLHTPEDLRQHSIRQAQELLDHAYTMERNLHAMWQEYRWTGKT